MTNEIKHTLLPFSIKEGASGLQIVNGDGLEVAILESEHALNPAGDAAFIVKACNSHYDLVEALELAEAHIESFYTATVTNAKSRDENRAVKKAALDGVRAALTKAKGA